MDHHGDSPTVARLRLGARLRALRTAAGITGERAGAALRATGSKISRLEGGEVPVRERDVDELLRLYGQPPGAERDEMLAMARESSGPGWWDPYSDSIPGRLRHCLEMEAAASVIAIYDPLALPALLHTDGYAQAVSARGDAGAPVWRGGLTPRTLERRRSLLASPHLPKLWVLLDEAALARCPGGPEVMSEQMAYLVKLAGEPHITVQIIPVSRSASVTAAAPFSILRFPASDLADVVFLELQTTITCLTQRNAVDRYWRVFNVLAADALNPETSLTILRSVAAGSGPSLGPGLVPATEEQGRDSGPG